jgi:hypothetical protein
MISESTIRSDLPNPNYEPELYDLVKKHQIHTCTNERCGGPAPLGHVCKRGFPRPFADRTQYNSTELRYIYQCITENDRWVVPYHAPTLFIWNAHMNCQYVSSRALGRYLTKYVVKPEPCHIFNISEGDSYREHVLARRLGSMECMFLLLGETICNSSVAVKYLPTELPKNRQRAIRPISTISEEDDDPYWKDHVEKYFARPHAELFESMTYPQYFANYRLSAKHPGAQTAIYVDDFGYFVTERSSPIIVRFRYLTLNDGEPYFYQQLLQNISCRNEQDLLDGCSSYREHFLKIHPQFQDILDTYNASTRQESTTYFQHQFHQFMNNLLEDAENMISPRVGDILRLQLDALKRLPPAIPQTAIFQLPEDQYKVFTAITENLGPLQKKKYPFFFITGSAGTGKSFMINLIIQWLKVSKKENYLLLAPTGIAADNIGGQTIHSALRLSQSESGFQSLVFYDTSFKKHLQQITTIIIDEISMVCASLLTFLANMFAHIHGTTMAFGGINIIVVGDLAQLPPVRGLTVFHSTVWHLFYPLFLRHSKRQEDIEFYNMLEEIRFGNISQKTWNSLLEKQQQYRASNSLDNILLTTHIVAHRQTADQINWTICNNLPVESDKFMISNALDFEDDIQLSPTQSQHDFKSQTNLSTSLRLQQGARVMFLNNSLMSEGICNGTMGIITDLKDLETSHPRVQVAFCTHGSIVQKWITRQTAYFYAGGHRASRTQFPLQNAFGLTVHKTQSLTLSNSSLDLANLFAPGHAYVSLSRCKTWENVQISDIHRDAFITDPEVVEEYKRLETLASQHLPIT